MGSLRDFDLPALKERFRLRVLVETGYGEGHSLQHAARAVHWDALHSIEIDPVIFEAVWRYIPPRSILWPGSSVDMLPKVLEQIADAGPALFWLDAHFPGSCSGADLDAEGEMDVRLPLEEEIRAIINNRDVSEDVFIVDDAWIYHDGVAECGDFDRRLDVAGRKSDTFLQFFLNHTHALALDPRANGYTIAVPKLAARYVLEDCLGEAVSAKLREF